MDIKIMSSLLQYYWYRAFRESLHGESSHLRWKKCFNCGTKINKPYQNPCCFECYLKDKTLIKGSHKEPEE